MISLLLLIHQLNYYGLTVVLNINFRLIRQSFGAGWSTRNVLKLIGGDRPSSSRFGSSSVNFLLQFSKPLIAAADLRIRNHWGGRSFF